MTEREAPPIDEIVDEKPRLDETGMASMPLDSVLKFEPEDRRMMDMLLKAADERLAEGTRATRTAATSRTGRSSR